MSEEMTRLALITAVALAAGLPAACNDLPDRRVTDTASANHDTGPPPDTLAPEDTADPPPSDDTGRPDTDAPDTAIADTSPADTTPADTSSPDVPVPDTTPGDTAPTPDVPANWRGQDFKGPKVAGQSDIALSDADWGVGLYWKTALEEDLHGPHQYIPNRQVLDLSKINAPLGDKDFRWNLPDQPAHELHYYKNYCKKVGDQTCKDRGIDRKPAVAVVMVGIHEAPASGQPPSTCTWGMIYGKRRCDFGQLVAASQMYFLYVYHDMQAKDAPILSKLGISGSLRTGWYAYPSPNPQAHANHTHPPSVVPVGINTLHAPPTPNFFHNTMFPMLPM